MPTAPAISAAGAHASRKRSHPTSQHKGPMIAARAMSVPITLRLIRGRASRAVKRGPITIAMTGPIPNITSGLRNRR